MDSCHFSGRYYPMVLKKSCSGNKVYVSNSIVNDDHTRYIRLDTTANTLYIGLGNDFTIETCASEDAAESTTVDYFYLFPNF